MLKSALCLWLLTALTAGQLFTVTRPETTFTVSGGSVLSPSGTSTVEQTAIGGAGGVKTATTITTASTAVAADTEGSGGGGIGAAPSETILQSTTSQLNNAAGATSSFASESTAALTPQASGGMTSTEKMGIGVGVGVGVPIIAGALAVFFLLRRRRRNRYGSERSASNLRDQPGMSSGAPALAGMSEMGRSPSKPSLPRTPSQHSLASMPPPLPEAKFMPPSQHMPTIARAPTQHSITPSLPEQHNLMSPPPAYEYDEAPSPMEEHPEPISPVSPISPVDSRPPSPINDHGR